MRRVDIAKIDRKLDNMIATSEFAKLQDVVIFQDTDGTYNLFNKYHITKKDVNNIVKEELDYKALFEKLQQENDELQNKNKKLKRKLKKFTIEE